MDLTDFLLARIAEDEALARTAIEPDNMHPWGDKTLPRLAPDRFPDEVRGYLGGPWGEHCANWSPLRVIAESAAKRAIVAEHREWRGPKGYGDPDGPMCSVCVSMVMDEDAGGNVFRDTESEPWPCPTLLALALPYADHPDYRSEWRPAD